MQVSSGIYLDAHVPALKLNRFPDPGVDLLRRNVAAAFQAADEYVWLYCQRGVWTTGSGKPPKYPVWSELLPGIETALVEARDPAGALEHAARAEFDALVASGNATNLARNGDLSQGPSEATASVATAAADFDGAAPAHWTFAQRPFSKGRFAWDTAAEAVRASDVRAGSIDQRIRVQSGDRLYIAARSRVQGNGAAILSLGWKNARQAWLRDKPQKLVIAPWKEASTPEDWSQWGTYVEVPEGAGFLVVMFGIEGQSSAADTLWWDDLQVVRLARNPG